MILPYRHPSTVRAGTIPRGEYDKQPHGKGLAAAFRWPKPQSVRKPASQARRVRGVGLILDLDVIFVGGPASPRERSLSAEHKLEAGTSPRAFAPRYGDHPRIPLLQGRIPSRRRRIAKRALLSSVYIPSSDQIPAGRGLARGRGRPTSTTTARVRKWRSLRQRGG